MYIYEIVLLFSDETPFRVVDWEGNEIFFGTGVEVYRNRDLAIGWKTLWKSKLTNAKLGFDEEKEKQFVELQLKE